MKTVTIKLIEEAANRLSGVIKETPLDLDKRLSDLYQAKIYVKREDLQEVRSYKIRGAYSRMSLMVDGEKNRGVVCASAGNHAQGVAWSAAHLKINTTIFMPITTPLQKISRVKHFGGKWIDIQLVGNTYDEASHAAHEFCEEKNSVYVHPFDDPAVIAGQGTVGKEIFDRLGNSIDYLIAPIGGGGFISGVSTYLKEKIPQIHIIGAEPKGAPSMYNSIKKHRIIELASIDTFVDGAAVKKPGEKTFSIVKRLVDKILLVPEGQVCTTMINIYQNEGIVAEPAGALSIAALHQLKDEIKGKTVVCVISGGNNDILRYPEIMERSLIFQGRKHYFLIEFAQKPGQLRKLLDNALGPTDDIVRFEYVKKNSKERGPALIGIELAKKEDYKPLVKRMEELEIRFKELEQTDLLYQYLI